MIVVTGGAGFIGSNLLAGLEARGEDPVAVCDVLGSDDKWRNIAKREIEDIVPPAELLSWLDANASRIHMIFHLGAISSTTETDADAIIANNFRLTGELWDWCAQRGIRLIYASSAAVYGDGSAGFDDLLDTQSLAALRPLNPYGWSKLLFDRRAARLASHRGQHPEQWAGLRFFNVYGPNEAHKGGQRSVVPQFWHQIREAGRARLFRSHHPDYADGGQLRDFVHVDDCVAVMLWLYDNPSVSGLFNLGTGQARSFADLARALFAAMELPAGIDYVDTPPQIRQHYQYFTQAKMDRLRAAGYDRPFISLEDGVRDYVQNYLEADDPYR
ncbi:MAG: ADP-glyceromanno-heptose 6-epimerase [Alphaproteobacteria bacterium]|jgi:ADP-L-glycero-D-manno-heptose 6-epimerase